MCNLLPSMTMDPQAALATAAAAGLLGSLHCAAMCGPLAMAAGARPDGSTDLRATAAYLGGRFVSYGALGALFGALGAHALCKLPVATAQTVAVVLVAGTAALRGVSLLRTRRAAPSAPAARRAAPAVALRLRPPRPPLTSRLFALLPRRAGALGLATGVLPCGMLIPAWTLAAVSGRPTLGALVMLVFAATSAPGLLLPLAGRRTLSHLTARLPASAAGLAWCALAVWIALRPLLAAAHHHHQ